VMSLSAGVTAVTPTELQKDRAAALVFSVNAAKNTQNIFKTGKSFVIDCTYRFDKKCEVYFYRPPKATEKRSK